MQNDLTSILSRLTLKSSRSEEAVEAQKIEAERKAEERYAKIIAKSRLPERYGSPHQNLLGDGWKARFCSIAGRLGTGMMVAFCGNRGTGKTQMAAELCHKAAREGLSCRYSTSMHFFLELRATFAKGADKTELAVVEDYASPSLLVIDEAQERGESDWHDRMLTMLLDKRYANLKDTIIISNQLAKVFLSQIGDSNASRIREMGKVFEFAGESYRKPVF